MRYYIADCHFFHRKMNTEMDKRGFESVEEMNEYMIKKWNKASLQRSPSEFPEQLRFLAVQQRNKASPQSLQE